MGAAGAEGSGLESHSCPPAQLAVCAEGRGTWSWTLTWLQGEAALAAGEGWGTGPSAALLSDPGQLLMGAGACEFPPSLALLPHPKCPSAASQPLATPCRNCKGWSVGAGTGGRGGGIPGNRCGGGREAGGSGEGIRFFLVFILSVPVSPSLFV